MTISNNNHRRKGILVVTETPEELAELQDDLGDAGFDLSHVAAGDDVFARLERRAPDLLVVDATSPAADGVALCRRFRSRPDTEAIPVIVIAQEAGHEQEEEFLEAGVDGLIYRPFQPVELVSRIRTLVRMKALTDRVTDQNRELLEVNARLDQLNQELTARNQELEQGMAMARRLQEALLPQSYPHIPNISFSHKYDPSDTVGGDVFQIDGLGDGRAAIFIADVSGHGVRGALITSIVRTVADYIDMEGKTPTEILKDFNSRFRGVLGPLTPQIYATGVIMIVDGQRRHVSAACAGHPSPFHIRKADTTAVPLLTLDDTGPALGFLPDPDYPTVHRELMTGDIVLAFTDGIYEVVNDRLEVFGLSNLRRLIAENAHLIPRDLIQRIITETEEFMGTTKRPDDVCMVAIEVH